MIKISPKCVAICQTENESASVQLMAWHKNGDKPLPDHGHDAIWRLWALMRYPWDMCCVVLHFDVLNYVANT